jgi:hypothetical protein
MPLTALPNELLTKILLFVHESSQLNEVTLACKHLNYVTEPLLYGGFWEQNDGSMGRFAKALISRPHLAVYVKSFEGSTSQPGVKHRDGTSGHINLRSYYNQDLTNEQIQWMRQSLPDAAFAKQFCDTWHRKLVNWYDNWECHSCISFTSLLKKSKLP